MNKRFLLPLLMSLISSGCIQGPDYQRPSTIADGTMDFIHSNTLSPESETDPNDPWWLNFGDPVTTQLVQQALKNNTDLRAAAARVLQSQALLEQAHGKRLPELNYSFGADRSQRSFNSPAGRSAFRSTTNQPSVSISYMVDIFGKLKRGEQADFANFLASQADQQALRQFIISQVINARIRISTLQRQLEITKRNTDNWQKAYDIVFRRYQSGILGPLDVRIARENLARSQSEEPSLELSLIKSRHALDVLLGRRPATSDPLPATLAELPELKPIAAALPAALLDRRPDIRQAEHHLQSATANVGVKMAQLFPDLTLSAMTGYNSNNTDNLFVSEAYIYSTIINLTGPIYRGGQLKAQVRQAQAQVEEKAANYTGIILKAIEEVENALASETLLMERYQALEVRFEQAQAAEKLAQDRYFKGVELLATALETERARREAQTALTIIKGQIWQARVELLLALGGNWDQLPEENTNQTSLTVSQQKQPT